MVFSSDHPMGDSSEFFVPPYPSTHTSPTPAFAAPSDLSMGATMNGNGQMNNAGFTPSFRGATSNHPPLAPAPAPAPVPAVPVNQQSLLEMFELDENLPGDDDDMDEDQDEVVDIEDQNQRVERLKGLLPTIQQLWWAKSQQMAAITERLANGSRDPKWRTPIGVSGILDFYLHLISQQSLSHELKLHTLRLIGNACADTDSNREHVVAHNQIQVLIQQLKDTAVLPFIIPVLFNVCVDYEPAQKQASENYLSRELIELVSSPRFSQHRAFLEYICRLLDLLIAQPGEPDRAPENLAVVLFTAIDHREATDLELFVAVINSAVAYLEHPRFQQALVRQSSLDGVLMLMTDSYTRFEGATHSINYPTGAVAEAQNEHSKLLSQIRNKLNQVLSDVSALPDFAAAYPVVCPTTSFLRRWISSPQKQLQVCACIMLGNLARSDRTCEEFVHVSQVHKPLINAISDTKDTQVLHAALGFLKNLALPAANKDVLGDAGLVTALPRLWSLDTIPQIQYSSVSLARILVTGSWANVQRICSPLSADPNSPAHERSQLSVLIALFSRTDAEPIKMEIARLLTAICRVFCTPSSPSSSAFPSPIPSASPSAVSPADFDLSSARHNFFETHPDICRPLSFMISQKKWPAIRSEGWFVFALMARTADGAQCVAEVMHDMGVFQPLVELLTGKSFVDGKVITPDPSPVASPEAVMSVNGQSPAMSMSKGHHSRNQSLQSLQSQNIQASPHIAHTPLPQVSGGDDTDMRRVDRENALVMVSELLRIRGGEMAVMRRNLLEDLLKGGTAIHVDGQ